MEDEIKAEGLLLIVLGGVLLHRLIAKQWFWEGLSGLKRLGQPKFPLLTSGERLARQASRAAPLGKISGSEVVAYPKDRSCETISVIMP